MLNEVRDHVARYLDGTTSASELARSLPDAWTIDRSADEDERRLVLRLMGLLAEHQTGYLSERDLQDRLRLALPSARTYWIEQARRVGSQIITGSEDAVTHPTVQEASEISRVVESV